MATSAFVASKIARFLRLRLTSNEFCLAVSRHFRIGYGRIEASAESTRGVGESPERPGIVHRLDKEASGLMVVAKTKKAFEALKRQFQSHSIEKEYSVLVHGRPPKDSGVVDLAIGRSADGGRMSARHSPMEGDRPAISRYRIEKLFPKTALLAVKIETGRTHQIRAHMKALGCPVVGDPLYGPRQTKGISSPRLFLHSRRLAFAHPTTGERMEFTSNLPDDLDLVLKNLC